MVNIFKEKLAGAKCDNGGSIFSSKLVMTYFSTQHTAPYSKRYQNPELLFHIYQTYTSLPLQSAAMHLPLCTEPAELVLVMQLGSIRHAISFFLCLNDDAA
jgi:hypothetical protein